MFGRDAPYLRPTNDRSWTSAGKALEMQDVAVVRASVARTATRAH